MQLRSMLKRRGSCADYLFERSACTRWPQHTILTVQDANAIDRIVEKLSRARSVTVLTGAGVSAASGVPTFRGKEGHWKSYRAESLATPEAFAENPHLVWEWYQWRRQLIAGCEPNQAHEILARWSRRFDDFTLITQNVDGLHERAGTGNVIRFHGSIWEVQWWSGWQDAPDR